MLESHSSRRLIVRAGRRPFSHRRRGHDRPGGDPPAAVHFSPFGSGGVGRYVAHAKAANVAAVLLGVDDCLVSGAIIGHRAFGREFAGVAIDDNQNKAAARHAIDSSSNLYAAAGFVVTMTYRRFAQAALDQASSTTSPIGRYTSDGSLITGLGNHAASRNCRNSMQVQFFYR